jgi:hypothetical protein
MTGMEFKRGDRIWSGSVTAARRSCVSCMSSCAHRPLAALRWPLPPLDGLNLDILDGRYLSESQYVKMGVCMLHLHPKTQMEAKQALENWLHRRDVPRGLMSPPFPLSGRHLQISSSDSP